MRLYLIFAAFLAGLAVAGWGSWEIQSWRYEGKLAKIERQNSALDQSNRDLSRKAELGYTVKLEGQTKFLTITAKEVHHATESLASCPVPADAVRMLNSAAACYADPAACAVHHEVRSAPGPAGRTDGPGPR